MNYDQPPIIRDSIRPARPDITCVPDLLYVYDVQAKTMTLVDARKTHCRIGASTNQKRRTTW